MGFPAAESLSHTPYQLVDAIPEVAAARQTERAQAEQLMASRRLAWQEGNSPASEWLPVDALSTAHSVLRAAEEYGEDSAVHVERYQGLVLDCQRLVGEWYRKKTSEYFEPVRHAFNPETEEFFSHGLSIRQMTENALMPIPEDPEEEARRINERVEDATPHILRCVGATALGMQSIRTISECTDSAITAYRSDIASGSKHRGYRGYVPEIEKVMIRDIRLDTESKDRFEEQLGLPGTYITPYVIRKALGRRGVAAMDMTKTELHGAQMLVDDDLLEFAKLLDSVASEEWCANIFMGEVVAPDHHKNYAKFREEALQRQEMLIELSGTVATFVLDLARENFDRTKAPEKVETFVKLLLLDLAKKNIEETESTAIAEQMFDIDTAKGLQEVVYLEATGRRQEAFALMQEVEAAAPGGGACGAGSCGLEAVNVAGEEGKELMKKLDAKSGDKIVKDKERSCPNCGTKNIIYAYNSKKVNKYCSGCEKFSSETTKAAA